MRIDIVTLFPELCDGFLSTSILGRARAKNLFEAHCHQIRDYTKNKQRQTDDYPYGGGCGMVLYAQPIADCLRAVADQCVQQGRAKPHVVFLTAAGQPYNEETARRLSSYESLALVCGHYEGIDQRVIDTFGDEEISIGDYVLTGDHNKIDAWRGRQSRERTRQRRPDLYDQWCATHPITQIPRWKRTERAQLIKTDAQLDAAAKLFAEGCRTVCRDVCTEAGLAEYTPEVMRQRLEEERKAGWAFYLHTTSDTPDGMVGVCHKTGEIGHLFVTQSARGNGIGTKLLDFARKKLAEHARPWLAVLDVNTAAIGLYRRMGYLPDGVRNMYQPGVDVAFCKPCKELVMRYQPQDQG